MINYFLITKEKNLDIRTFEDFLYTFLFTYEFEEYPNFYLVKYKDSEVSVKEALNSYIFDLSLNSRIYIGQNNNEDDFKVDLKYLLNHFNNTLKDIFYDKKSLLFELIKEKNDIDLEFVIKDYKNDYSMQQTLISFFMHNMNVVKTSKDLYLHRNTLINKLDRFKEKTGFDPKEFRDAYILYSILN